MNIEERKKKAELLRQKFLAENTPEKRKERVIERMTNMKPFGNDNACVSKLYGAKSKIGLNILRMEISPSFTGDNWGDYDWNGSLPSAQTVKKRGGIVFGTPWSPPGEYKTNGTAQGGNSDNQGNVRGKLREDCYEKFFP
jgi:glucuronoarabinoxylan endo-1,4-beta-xylanase